MDRALIPIFLYTFRSFSDFLRNCGDEFDKVIQCFIWLSKVKKLILVVLVLKVNTKLKVLQSLSLKCTKIAQKITAKISKSSESPQGPTKIIGNSCCNRQLFQLQETPLTPQGGQRALRKQIILAS
jgi:hypothetical protein